MRKYGFKIFSTDLKKSPDFLLECIDFANSKKDVFMELMVLPETLQSDLMELKKYTGDIEVRIHAPHNMMGFDVGDKELEKHNQDILSLSQMAADIFGSKTIIVHAGCGCGDKYINETIRQIKLFNDKRIVVENLPCVSIDAKPLHGNTAQEIKYIMQETGCGFCFDFSHAICAALELNLNIESQLKSFYDLKPDVYHLCDGIMTTAEDLHIHFGQGNYLLKHFLNDLTDDCAVITMETGKRVALHGNVLFQDYEYLKSLITE